MFDDRAIGMAALVFVFALAVAVGCIRDEPLCPYADIEDFALPENVMMGKATINGEQISVFARKGADLSALVPEIRLSEGASVSPDAGTPQDFTRQVAYTVTAADGKHSREYTVRLTSVPLYSYGFERWEVLDKKYAYETPVEYDRQGNTTTPWDSSNKGISIYQQYSSPSLYPIHRTTQSASGEYAAEMLTLDGPGSILGITNIPIVAGSLFTGTLHPLNALSNPLLATEFGQPFDAKPLKMTGKYIYKAGAGSYIDSNGRAHAEKKDSCNVYAVLFHTGGGLDRLNGTNVLSHANIVAVAMMSPEERAGSEGEGFADFDLPFVYREGHALDFEKNSYKLAVIFSSSFMGDYYEGTPGSRLVVDDIEIITEEMYDE
ncbi:MAG: PCMD domain-containing protein [Tannerellaceae bacterium]|nr:PCMD domain-containing protein [Tannerellaceae bacterium]